MEANQRLCPSCGKLLTYKHAYTAEYAERDGVTCNACAASRRSPDLTNRRFGRLTALYRAPNRNNSGQAWWVCKCDCGKTTEVRGSGLTFGTKSCGCLQRDRAKASLVDLTGQRFNMLTVLSRAGSDPKDGKTLFNCLCDCGRQVVIRGNTLRPGKRGQAPKQISCGCHKTKSRVELHNYLKAGYVYSAKQRGYEFSLSQDQFERLVSSSCHYCGVPASRPFPRSYRSVNKEVEVFLWNGIDRVDSSKGYTPDNVVSCCLTCNHMKLDHSREDFLAHIERILNHQQSLRPHLVPEAS